MSPPGASAISAGVPTLANATVVSWATVPNPAMMVAKPPVPGNRSSLPPPKSLATTLWWTGSKTAATGWWIPTPSG